MNKYLKLVLCILLPLTIGAIGGFATSSGISTWYVYLNKPFFNPPNYLFGPVWTMLYVLMGISHWVILQSPAGQMRTTALRVYAVQLAFNLLWSLLFFGLQSPGIAFVDILLLWCSIAYMISVFYKINRKAAWLQLPYILWVSFATLLNGAIWYLN